MTELSLHPMKYVSDAYLTLIQISAEAFQLAFMIDGHFGAL
jgi:hypothetical protein